MQLGVRKWAACRLALLSLFTSLLHAAEDRLVLIHGILIPMRSTPVGESRGATSSLTDVKHQLREWIEIRLAALQWTDGGWTTNLTVLQEELNAELNRAGLFCPPNANCGQNRLGYLGRLALEIQSGFLVVRTSVGVQVCGTDDSAYIYEWVDQWRRIWQSEQNDYREKTYFPQRLIDVKISPTDWRPNSDHRQHLIATTGVLPWCSSVWQPVYYRVWQTKSTYAQPLLLLDASEMADIAAPIHARANPNDVFIEFQIIADDAMRVSELLHYVLENGKLRRTDPVALTPHNFVSFWLRHPWTEISEWTAQGDRATLRIWREQYRGTNSEFASPTRRCTSHADLWQVASDAFGPNLSVHYFLIRARPPFRFTMVSISDHPWPDCTEDDPAIDNAPDLFDK